MKPYAGTLYLIAWPMGDNRNLTLNAAAAARRLRVFLTEHANVSRQHFSEFIGAAASKKEFLDVPAALDEAFLERILALLKTEDVGLVSDGGVPCFVDPGAWLVENLRRRGVKIKTLPGGSALTMMLSLSGIEWCNEPNRVFSFGYFVEGALNDSLVRAAQRDEALFIFVNVRSFGACLEIIAPVLNDRPVTAFFDLNKTPPSRYPYADLVVTRTCRAWRDDDPSVDWARVSDVCLMVEPKQFA